MNKNVFLNCVPIRLVLSLKNEISSLGTLIKLTDIFSHGVYRINLLLTACIIRLFQMMCSPMSSTICFGRLVNVTVIFQDKHSLNAM